MALLNLIDDTTDDNILQHMSKTAVYQPAIVTCNQSQPFPMNTANKRVWLTLTDEEIAKQIDEMESTTLEVMVPVQMSDEKRIDIYHNIVVDESKIDRFRLGAIEMYGTLTYRNILNDPRVTLHFHWFDPNEPANIGIQINCIAEIAPPRDPFYRYMRALTYLYGWRYVDIPTTEYPCAYKLWISEIRIKSLDQVAGFI